MEKILSCYLWAWRNYKSGEKSVKSVRKFYPDADVFINVDFEGDHENYIRVSKEITAIYSKNNFQVGYCGDYGAVKIGRECWPKDCAFEWIRGLYEACLKTDSKYMIILEEDDFVLKNISILNEEFSMAIHAQCPSPAGKWRPNYLPNEFMLYSAEKGGISSAPGYGAAGGCIFNRQHFINSWEKCKNDLWNDYDYLKKINKIIGWEDFLVQFIMMIGGYEITQNRLLGLHWELPNSWKEFEIVCGIKDLSVLDEIYSQNINQPSIDEIKNFENWLAPTIKENIEIVENNLKNGDVFIDIGANSGLFTKTLLNKLKEKSCNLKKIILFEPVPYLTEECRKKFINDSNIIIEQFALSDKNAEKVILASKTNLGYNKIYKEGMEIHTNYSYKINCITFSEWIKNSKIDVVNFIKIDAEGHDINIIYGMFDWLEKTKIKPDIFFEINWYKEEEEILIEKMKNLFNYTVIRYDRDILLKANNS